MLHSSEVSPRGWYIIKQRNSDQPNKKFRCAVVDRKQILFKILFYRKKKEYQLFLKIPIDVKIKRLAFTSLTL